eukprot:TRINITY_DN50456_c0_g1_i1.p1 TRINITY_DN50456_c0_g1~~TRINITY_DN50456_c0_g1_i1.p1  ORF type:complete len:323 (-),score=71.19 TRINITY_DN50456_c0_g1_i1:415-1245(-)
MRRRTSKRTAPGARFLCIGAGAVVTLLLGRALNFVPASGRPSTRGASELARSAAAKGKEEDAYDWQKVGTAADTAMPNLDDLPDLPDFGAEEEEKSAQQSAGQGQAQAMFTKVRRVELPDLPGDADLLPPAPNPITDGGLGLMEWTGIWAVAALALLAVGGAGSYALARAGLDPEFANQALMFCKVFFGFFQVAFLGRVLLAQWPKIDPTAMPWTPLFYSTEFLLAPTRTVFKPEAGVDVAPIMWFLIAALGSELLTGPSGILQLARDSPRMPAGF